MELPFDGAHRWGQMDHVTWVMQWRDTESFGKRGGKWGGGVALYEAEQLDCMELFLGMDNEPTEILWAITKHANVGDTVLGQ